MKGPKIATIVSTTVPNMVNRFIPKNDKISSINKAAIITLLLIPAVFVSDIIEELEKLCELGSIDYILDKEIDCVLITIIILRCYNKMGIVFESVLLFSLAVLVIAVGLLVYYFKSRIAEIESKNTKCLEIVHDVFLQHTQLKQDVMHMSYVQEPAAMRYYQQNGGEDQIQIHLEEDGEEEEEGDYDVDEGVKIVNVDMSGPVDSDINIADEIEDAEDVEHLEQLSEKPITKIDVHDSDLESDNEEASVTHSEPNNDAFREIFNPDTKESYKKMDVKSLRRLVVSRGLATENTTRLKKNELIDILLTII